MQTLSTEDIQNIQIGNIEPLKKVFLAHYEYCTMALVKFDNCSLADAKDMVMDAIQVLHSKIVQGNFHNDNLKSFLLTVAKNKWRNKQKRDQKSLPFDPVKVERYLNKKDTTVELSSYQQQKVDAVLWGLKQMGGKCAPLIRRNLYDGVSLKELVVELDYKSMEVLKSSKSRCLKKLKLIVNEELLKTTPNG